MLLLGGLLLVACAHSEQIQPASIEKEVVPFLISELRTGDERDSFIIIGDLGCLGPRAAAALPAIQARARTDTTHRKLIEEAIRQIQGERLEGPFRLCHDGLSAKTTEFPVVDDLTIEATLPDLSYRVGEPINISIRTDTASPGKYHVDRGEAGHAIGAVRLDRRGRRHPVNVPVDSIARRGGLRVGYVHRPIDIPLEKPDTQDLRINRQFILDVPGDYIVELESVARSSPTAAGRVRSRSTFVRFTVLPRDQEATVQESNRLATGLEDAYHWNDNEWALIELIDYGSLPILFGLIEAQGDAGESKGAIATDGLAFFCDKKRIRDEALRFIDAKSESRGRVTAGHWARVLASAEAIPCAPNKARSDVDFVRFEAAWLRWYKWLKAGDPLSPR